MNNNYILNNMNDKDVSEKKSEKVISTEPKKKKPRCHFCKKKLKMTYVKMQINIY